MTIPFTIIALFLALFGLVEVMTALRWRAATPAHIPKAKGCGVL